MTRRPTGTTLQPDYDTALFQPFTCYVVQCDTTVKEI